MSEDSGVNKIHGAYSKKISSFFCWEKNKTNKHRGATIHNQPINHLRTVITIHTKGTISLATSDRYSCRLLRIAHQQMCAKFSIRTQVGSIKSVSITSKKNGQRIL